MSLHWAWVFLLHLPLALSNGYERSDSDYFYPSVARRPVDVVADVINVLGIRILQMHDTPGNVAFSPTGAAFVLTALYEGSAGEGSKQIAEVLGLPRDRDVTRIGFRDMHRRLRTYLNADGFLGGLTLSNENTKLRPEYEDVLRFYGFDLGGTQPEINSTSAIPGDTTTESTGDNEPPKETVTEVVDTVLTGKPTNGEITAGTTTLTTVSLDSTTQSASSEVMLTTSENPVTSTSTVSAVEVLDETTESGTLPDRLLQSTTNKMIDVSSTVVPSSTIGVDFSTTLPSTSAGSTTVDRVSDSSVLTTMIPPTTNSPFTTQSAMENPSTIPVTPGVTTDASTMTTVTTTTTVFNEESTTVPTRTVVTTTTAEVESSGAEPSTVVYSPTDINTESSTVPQISDSSTLPATVTPVTEPTTRIFLTTLLAEIVNRITADDEDEASNELLTTTESLASIVTSAEINTEIVGGTDVASDEIIQETTSTMYSETTEDVEMSSEVDSELSRATRMMEETLSSSLTDKSFVTTDQVEPLMKSTESIAVEDSASSSTISTDLPVNETSTLRTKSEENDSIGSTDRGMPQATTDNTKRGATSAMPVTEQSTTSANGSRRRSSRSPRGYFYSVPDAGAWLQEVGSWRIYPASANEATVRDSTQISFLVKGCDISLVSATTYVAVLPFAFFPTLRAVALEFPLDDPRYNILLLMPTERTDTHRLARELGGKSLRLLRKHLQPTWVRATIPSFMLRGFVTLTSFLQRLGIADVFEPRLADLSPMTTDKGVYARDVQQSIGVNIRNYMTVDRTHSRNGLFERAGPVPFTAQHPFLYFIIDAETSATLIAGRVDDPLNSRIL